MSTEADQLPDDATLLKQMVCEQAETIRRSEQRIGRLEHLLEQLLRSKYGPRSERLDPRQLQLFDQEDAYQTDDDSQSPGDDPSHDDSVVVGEHRRRGGGRKSLPDHLPLYRLEDVFARHGVELPRSTLCRWALQTAEILERLYELMIERVCSSAAIHTDDTPVPVLDPRLPKTRTARFWVYCGDWRNPYTVYDYTTSRKRDGPADFLRNFRGYLHADAFAGYDGIYAGGQVKQVLCWAHARRKFYEARTVQPEPAHAALAYIAQLYAVERKAKALADADELNDEEAWKTWHRERAELRQKKSLPILDAFHDWLAATEPRVLPKSPVGQAIGYVLPRWDGLIRYCENGALSIDNNLSERMVRPVAIGRKNYLFLGSDNGGKAAAILYSVMASAKANQAEPFAYVRDLLMRLSGKQPDDLSELLPDKWLTTHPESRRRWSR